MRHGSLEVRQEGDEGEESQGRSGERAPVARGALVVCRAAVWARAVHRGWLWCRGQRQRLRDRSDLGNGSWAVRHWMHRCAGRIQRKRDAGAW